MGGGLDGGLMAPIVINELIEAGRRIRVRGQRGALMTTISFQVNGWPPNIKKNAKSMLRNPTQAERLNALRKAARAALGGQACFTRDIRLVLVLRVHVGRLEDERSGNSGSGDLDNFVSGVCDGLMRAHPNTPSTSFHDLFRKPENSDVHPTKSLAFEDDSQVVKINAEKLVGPEDHSWYEIELEEQ